MGQWDVGDISEGLAASDFRLEEERGFVVLCAATPAANKDCDGGGARVHVSCKTVVQLRDITCLTNTFSFLQS